MNIIFLDIDGVMNSTEDRFSTELENKDYWIRLKRLVNKTNSAIVLSSAWRIIERLTDCVKERLNEYNIKYIDKTPYLSGRGNEIKTWLDSTDIKVDKFVIIDDEISDIVGLFPDNVVKTDMHKGLQDEDIEKAIKILK
jgi:histidinol phosphatase-like enzyme